MQMNSKRVYIFPCRVSIPVFQQFYFTLYVFVRVRVFEKLSVVKLTTTVIK